MSKIPSLIGPELQYLEVSYLFHFGFFGPHYFLQEISDTTFSRRFRRIIGPSLLFTGGFSDPWEMQDLLQSIQHFELDTLTVYTPSQNNFGPQKSNLHPFFFKNSYVLHTNIFLDTLFFVSLFVLSKSPTRNINITKWYILLQKRKLLIMF